MGFTEIKTKIEDFTRNLIKERLTQLKGFNNDECSETTNDISHRVCEFIKGLGTEDKYIVNTTLFEKGNLGITMSGTCIWDTMRDGFLNINEESQQLIIVVTIWCLSCE